MIVALSPNQGGKQSKRAWRAAGLEPIWESWRERGPWPHAYGTVIRIRHAPFSDCGCLMPELIHARAELREYKQSAMPASGGFVAIFPDHRHPQNTQRSIVPGTHLTHISASQLLPGSKPCFLRLAKTPFRLASGAQKSRLTNPAGSKKTLVGLVSGQISLSAQSSGSSIGQDPPRSPKTLPRSAFVFAFSSLPPSHSCSCLQETHPGLVSLIFKVQQPTSERQRCQRFPSLPLHFSSDTPIRSDSHAAPVLFPKNPSFWADRRAPYHAGCSKLSLISSDDCPISTPTIPSLQGMRSYSEQRRSRRKSNW